jgi:hypothetical protein
MWSSCGRGDVFVKFCTILSSFGGVPRGVPRAQNLLQPGLGSTYGEVIVSRLLFWFLLFVLCFVFVVKNVCLYAVCFVVFCCFCCV